MRSSIALAMLMLAADAVHARMTKHVDAKERLKASDLVIKGQVVSVTDMGVAKEWDGPVGKWMASQPDSNKPNIVAAEIKVEAEIKGSANGQIVKVSYLQHSAAGFPGPKKDDVRVFFLKRHEAGYRPIDTDNWLTTASKKKIVRSSAARDEDVLYEEIRAKVEEDDVEQVKQGLDELDELAPERASGELAKFRKSKNAGIRARALVRLMGKGDVSAGDELKELVSRDMKGPARREQREIRNDVSKALWDIHRKRDARFAPTAIAFINHEDEIIRTAARYALRGMRDPKTVPELVKLLDDSSRDSQYIGVVTLCEIEKKPGCPSIPLFEQNPDKYVKEWKDWWAEKNKSR